jgi:hypothetical protein
MDEQPVRDEIRIYTENETIHCDFTVVEIDKFCLMLASLVNGELNQSLVDVVMSGMPEEVVAAILNFLEIYKKNITVERDDIVISPASF